MTRSAFKLLDPALLRPAMLDALRKLDPRVQWRNPVMFVVYVGSWLTTGLAVDALFGAGDGQPGFVVAIAMWLWFTVLFANFAEAVAEGRGKAQADALRRTRSDTTAKLMLHADDTKDDPWEPRSAHDLAEGDVVLVEASDTIPADGEVIEGIASVNESAITGESAPVIRESGGDRSAVTGGTVVLSDWIKVRVTASPGSSFLDRMIALVEGAERQKTPNELALSILLSGLTLILLIAVVTLWGFAGYSGTVLSVTVLVALLVTLIPTTIGGLLSAIGIAGMDRLVRFNVVATSGRAVEAAGDVDTLLLDKTGTITYGNRLATAFVPVPGLTERDVAEAALLASLSDETPEGRSIVALARGEFGLSAPVAGTATATAIPFSAQTRISGIDIDGRSIRKGAVDAVLAFAGETLERAAPIFRETVQSIARSGGTPLAVADGSRLIGVIHLKDVVKPDIKARFASLRKMATTR
jgi:K+-transporting ATPase ATPase B chain